MAWHKLKSDWAAAKAKGYWDSARELEQRRVEMGRYGEKRRQLEYLQAEACRWEGMAARYRREEERFAA